MKKYFFFIAVILLSLNSLAQITDSGSFYLHKFAQNIGRESYIITRSGKQLTYDINFKFVDRGSPVPLKAQLVTTVNTEPVSLFIKGNTSRFSEINDSIWMNNKQVIVKVNDAIQNAKRIAVSFPVGGYSPGTVQMALLQYWKKHGKPKNIPLLPTGNVTISMQGRDSISVNDQPAVVLDRYILGGLVWGNEIIWTDGNGNLAALITNDAEGDKLEMMRTDLESLLPELLERAANYGMQLFSSSMNKNGTTNKLIAILGGNIIDVEGSTTLINYDLFIENGVITHVGKSGSIKVPDNATVIQAKGKTILPGLWDMHAHFEQAEWGPAYLASGVTTVRDCGNEFVYINAVKTAIDSHKGVGPNIIKAGIIDGPGPMGLGIVRASTAKEAVEAVDRYFNNGFQQIKIYSSITPPIVKAICDEAHRLGLSVTGHIPNNMSTQAGIDSGMNQINHMQYVYAMMKKKADRSVDLKDTANQAALDFLKAKQVVVDPTMGVFEMVLRSTKDNILDMEPNYKTLPIPLQSLFVNMGMPPADAKRLKPMFQSMLNLVKALYDKGIPIVAGTDMGFPGYSLDRELELYVMAGLSPMEAIQSATIIPAMVMKMNKHTGVIRIGRNADILILNADPLKDIRNIRQVSQVIREGQLYDPAKLKAMAGFSK